MVVAFFLIILYIGFYNDHHCAVPANVSIDDVIPREIGPDGDVRYDQCDRYNITGDNTSATVACFEGWDYDEELFDAKQGTIVIEVRARDTINDIATC